jgi:hypothetical protein
MANNFDYDVFLSHSGSDGEAAGGWPESKD